MAQEIASHETGSLGIFLGDQHTTRFQV